MKNALALLVVSCAGIAVSSAHAQGLQGSCSQQVEYLCGDDPASQCFADESLWAALSEECHLDQRMIIEMEREGNAESGYGPNGTGFPNFGSGFSYGGLLRNGPSMDYERLGSLFDGDEIEIVEASGEWMNGYQWYVINSPVGQGFHWGGLFCSHKPLEGVFTTCSEGF